MTVVPINLHFRRLLPRKLAGEKKQYRQVMTHQIDRPYTPYVLLFQLSHQIYHIIQGFRCCVRG